MGMYAGAAYFKFFVVRPKQKCIPIIAEGVMIGVELTTTSNEMTAQTLAPQLPSSALCATC